MIPIIGRTAWTGNIREGFELIDGEEWTAHALPNGGSYNLPPVYQSQTQDGVNYLGELYWGVSRTFIRTHIIVIRFAASRFGKPAAQGGAWHAPFYLKDEDGYPVQWKGGAGNDKQRFICANASFQVHGGPSVSRFIIGQRSFRIAGMDCAAYVDPGVSDGTLVFHTEKKPVLVYSVREFRHYPGGLVDELK